MGLFEQFVANIEKDLKIVPSQNRLLLAVSGGLDSVVMTHLCYKAGFSIAIAHCNFQLRGDESVRDEQFARQLAGKYAIPIHVNTFDTATYATNNQLSIQLAARKLRYDWFGSLIENKVVTTPEILSQQTNNLWLCTAHHADDNIETLLLNFFRGTGIQGLHGILPKQGNILRPLLFATRKEIEDYALSEKLSWVEDSSNASDKYSRNYLRHQLIPLLKQIYPRVEENLLDNIERFNDVEYVYQQSINQSKASLIEQKGEEYHIPILKLKKQKPLKTIVYEIVKDFGFSSHQTQEVIKLLDARNGSNICSATHRIIVNRNWLIIAALKSNEATNHVVIDIDTKQVLFREGVLQLKNKTIDSDIDSAHLDIATNIANLDTSDISYPLILRPYKQGDYFYPLGMDKKKKLSKFFIDLKLSKLDKEKIWVVESDKRIIWVVGHRLDNRFRIKPHSKNLLQLIWKTKA